MNIKQIMAKQKLSTEGPISNMKNLPILDDKPTIIINESAIEVFNSVKNDTTNERKINFVLIGYETSYGIVYIEECAESIHEFNMDNVLNGKAFEFLDKYVESASKFKRGQPIMFLGYRNPAKYIVNEEGENIQQDDCNCWNSEDLIDGYEYIKYYKDKIKVAQMLITPSLDINTLYLETNKGEEMFYKFSKVLTFNSVSKTYDKEDSYSNISKPFKNNNEQITKETITL